MEEETVVEEYDTSVPADIHSGSPPLKKRTTTTIKKRTQTDRQEQSDTCSVSAISQNEHINQETATETTHSNETRQDGWVWFKIGIATTVFLVLVVLIVKRYLNSNLKIFKLWKK